MSVSVNSICVVLITFGECKQRGHVWSAGNERVSEGEERWKIEKKERNSSLED